MTRRPDRILLKAGRGTGLPPMRVVNDDVMGGESTSSVTATSEGMIVFSGNVSLENFGGFATCRTRPGRTDIRGYDGIRLLVRTDGKRYALFLKNNDEDDGSFYRAYFKAPAGLWSTVSAPLSELKPRFRGMPDLFAGPLDAGDVRVIGLLIADKQAGPFRLELAWIGAYKKASASQ